MATLLQKLIREKRLTDYSNFRHEYCRAAKALARGEENPSIGTATVSESTFERWRDGKATPQTTARIVLSHLFQRPIAELLSEMSHTDLGIKVVDAAPESSPDIHTMGRIAAMAARRAIEFALGAEQRALGPETLAYIEGEVRRLAECYTRVPLADILSDLSATQDLSFRILESGRATPAQSRDLYFFSSLLSGMLAKAAHDLSDPQSAMMQARTAVVCATQITHTPMIAWVRGLQSLISYWANRPADALHYAQVGASNQGTGGTVTVWLASLEARAAALVGDKESTHIALQRATSSREYVQPSSLDALGGNFTFPKNRQDYYAVEANVLLGDATGGLLTRAEEAVAALNDENDPTWSFSDEAGARANLAMTHLYGRDLEAATHAMQPILDLPPGQRNAGIIGSMARVRDQLQRDPLRAERQARGLRDEIELYSSHRTRALP